MILKYLLEQGIYYRTKLEGANEPEQLNEKFEFKEPVQIDSGLEQLNKIFEIEEAAQKDPELEQLSKIFKVEEAAQRDPEWEQLNNGFPESNKKQILP